MGKQEGRTVGRGTKGRDKGSPYLSVSRHTHVDRIVRDNVCLFAFSVDCARSLQCAIPNRTGMCKLYCRRRRTTFGLSVRATHGKRKYQLALLIDLVTDAAAVMNGFTLAKPRLNSDGTGSGTGFGPGPKNSHVSTFFFSNLYFDCSI